MDMGKKAKAAIKHLKESIRSILSGARSLFGLISKNLNPAIGDRRLQNSSQIVSVTSGLFFTAIYTLLEILRASRERLYRSDHYVLRKFVGDNEIKCTEEQLLQKTAEKIKANPQLEEELKKYAKKWGYLLKIEQIPSSDGKWKIELELQSNALEKPVDIKQTIKPSIATDIVQSDAKIKKNLLNLDNYILDVFDNLPKQLIELPKNFEESFKNIEKSAVFKKFIMPIWNALDIFSFAYWLQISISVVITLIAGIIIPSAVISISPVITFSIAAVLPIAYLLYRFGKPLYYWLTGKEKPAKQGPVEINEAERARIQLIKLAIIYENYMPEASALAKSTAQTEESAEAKLAGQNEGLPSLELANNEKDEAEEENPQLEGFIARYKAIKKRLLGNRERKVSFATIIAFLSGYIDTLFIIIPFTTLATFLLGVTVVSLPSVIIATVLLTFTVGTLKAFNAAFETHDLQDEHKQRIKDCQKILVSIEEKRERLAQQKSPSPNKSLEEQNPAEEITKLRANIKEKLQLCNAKLAEAGYKNLDAKIWNPSLDFPAYDDEPFFKRLDLDYKKKLWTGVDIVKLLIGDVSNGLFFAKSLLTAGVILLLIAAPAVAFGSALIFGVGGVCAAIWIAFKIYDYFQTREWEYSKLFLDEVKLRDAVLDLHLQHGEQAKEVLTAKAEELKGLENNLDKLKAESKELTPSKASQIIKRISQHSLAFWSKPSNVQTGPVYAPIPAK